MSKLKRLSIWILFCSILFFSMGCDMQDANVKKMVSAVKEVPPLPSFKKEPEIPEPEKVITQIDLPSSYSYKERNENNTYL